jgi:cobalt-zinc-cadmium efflux system outer membrane protein
MTLADFEQMALNRNPTLVMARSGVDVARGRAWQAGLWPNPTVGYVNEVLGTAAAPEYLGTLGEFMGARVRQEIPMANKRRISRNKYEWEAETANWHALAQHMSVLNGVRVRFFEVLAHQRILDYRRLLFKIADAGLRTTEELVNDGQANVPDLLAAQIAARQARIDLVHAENLYRRSWNSLITTVGAAELREPIRLDGPLESDAPPLDFEAELARLLELNPHVKAAQAQAKRDETTVLRERVEPIPNLIVQLDGGFSYLENGPATNIFVGAEIPIWNRNQGTLFQAQSDLSRARAEIERVALDLQNRLGDSFAHYNIALVTVGEYRDEILPRARQAYELLEESYRRQRAAWPQVLVAQRNWVELSIDYVNALFELRRREIEIRGLLQVDGLNVPQGPRELGHLNAVATPR